MAERADERGPLLVAVWPGLGQVALTAGYYFMSKLHMQETEPLPAQDLFDVDQVDIQEGLVRTARLPTSRLFRWKDPAKKRDLIVLIGEAQPPAGKLTFCGRLLDYAQRLGVKEVYTFAAMADDVPLRSPSRVFGIATHPEGREKLRRAGIEVLSSGRISGMNGVLLGIAAQKGFRGIGLLGEMPALMTPVPFAKASCAVLEAFCRLSGVQIELAELQEYGRTVETQMAEAIETLQKAVQQRAEEAAEEPVENEAGPPGLSEEESRRIEKLFDDAVRERVKTFELKRELDRLGVFSRYEDRFLDLFRDRGKPGDREA